jgi:hypothetical protein
MIRFSLASAGLLCGLLLRQALRAADYDADAAAQLLSTNKPNYGRIHKPNRAAFAVRT